MPNKFNFDKQREQSAVKTEIVVRYFEAWTKIMISNFSKIAYVDLFAGPGIYDDGNKSTPVLILEKIIASEKLRNKIQVYLNEKDYDNYIKLKNNILDIKNISLLNYKPIIENKKIDYDAFKWLDLPDVPTFCFLDPSGYYGLSQNLIRKIGNNYGSDIIFFFNFNDINRAVNNKKVLHHMVELFGESRFKDLLQNVEGLKGEKREVLIVNEMKETIREAGLCNVLPFKFKLEGKNRTSHYIYFATKNNTAFKIMKEIMWKIGEKDIHGIATYGFISSHDKENGMQLSIIDLIRDPYEEFKIYLCRNYAGRTFTVNQLYEIDSPCTPFILKQYKDVLKDLENNGKIQCFPSSQQRRKNTMADTVKIKFPCS